jgi:hypothetical protein
MLRNDAVDFAVQLVEIARLKFGFSFARRHGPNESIQFRRQAVQTLLSKRSGLRPTETRAMKEHDRGALVADVDDEIHVMTRDTQVDGDVTDPAELLGWSALQQAISSRGVLQSRWRSRDVCLEKTVAVEVRKRLIADALAHPGDWRLRDDVSTRCSERVEVVSVDLQAELWEEVGEAERSVVVGTLQQSPVGPWGIPLAGRDGEATLTNESLELKQIQHFVRREPALRTDVELFDSFPRCGDLECELPLFQHAEQS